MRVDDFLVERWLNTYEHNVEINLAETCVDPFTLGGFLEFTKSFDFLEKFMNTKLTYGFIEGNPELREGIASWYEHAQPEEILVTGGAIEANFNSFYSLIEPGDTVISVAPTYQQLYSVAKGFGAEVKLLKLRPENGWLPDIEELKGLVDGKTKMIIINNPNNPTGSLIETGLLRAICDVAEDSGAYLHSDEAYRGLYVNPGAKVPSTVDLYDKAISVGSFSKPLSLTGLRLGWITAKKDVIRECMRHRDYTTISKGMIDEALALIAVKNSAKIMERNNDIIRKNHALLDKWIDDEPAISWVSPRAGSTGFMRVDSKVSSEELCRRIIEEKSTLLVPGECFGVEKHMRIGFGNDTAVLRKGLSRLKDFLDANK